MCSVYIEILSKCKSVHHAERYIKFIRACVDRNTELQYYEAHHILPKSVWPEYQSFRASPWNKAKLTGRQHYIAHWMLARALGGGMWTAFNAMCNIRTYRNGVSSKTRTFKVTSTAYEELRKNHAEYQKVSNTGEGNPFYGKTHSDEAKARMSASADNSGTNNPMYGRRGVDSPLSGQKSDEHLQKIKDSLALVEDVTCPVCNQSGHPSGMMRWHFDNCGVNSSMSGSANPRAGNIKIFNADGIMMFDCNGDFESICTKHNLPQATLAESYRLGGKAIYQNKSYHAKVIKKGYGEFIGWYAMKV